MPISSTGVFIDELLIATQGEGANPRQQYLLRQTLHGLVRQAKAEQLAEMRAHTEKLVGAAHFCSARRQTKAILRRIEMACDNRQRELEFDRDDETPY